MAARLGRRGTRRLLIAVHLIAVLAVLLPVAYSVSSSVARSEAQNAADAAALAGAAALMATVGDTVIARGSAEAITARNTINGAPAEMRPGDVTFDVDEGRIDVRVRGRALPFSLPRVRLEVTAKAAAEGMLGSDPPDPRRLPKILRLVE